MSVIAPTFSSAQRNRMKPSLAWFLHVLGVTRFAAWWHRKHVVILNYHDIGEADRGSHYPILLDLSVSLESFRSQIAYLRRRHHVISLREFLMATAEGKRLPEYSVVLTFDDGYKSFLDVAPLLLNHNLPATLFLVTDMMRQEDVDPKSTQEHADRLSWTEVQTLDQHDIFDFGSHTCSHPSLPSLTPEAIENELRASLNEIRGKVKRVMPALAYPNGAYSGLSIDKIAAAGYACALTIDSGPNKLGTNPYHLLRQTIRGHDDRPMFAARLSCLTPWLYSLREKAHAPLNRVIRTVSPATSSFKLRTLKKGSKFLLRYLGGYFKKGRFTAPDKPRMSVETTNICNAKCVFCANPIMERRKEHLEMEKFKKAVDEFAAMGGKVLDFNVTIGDPLLDPLLLERARYTKLFPQFGFVGFVTTLQWLHRWNMDEFFESGIGWLSISITLSGREKYKEFFGVDKYEQTLKNLLLLIEENKKRGGKILFGVYVKPTDEPIEQVLNHPDFKLIDSMVEQDLAKTLQDEGFYVDDWLGTVELPAYLKKRPLYPRAFRPCQLLYSGLMVYSNGKVGACACRDFEASSELILGNVAEQSLEDMWKGEKLASLRSNWLKKNQVPDICKSCRHYLY